MTDEDLIDELSEAIYDSLDMDWRTEDGARVCLPLVRRLEAAAREEGRRAGLEEAAKVARGAFDDRPNRQGWRGVMDWTDGYDDGTKAAAEAIRANGGDHGNAD